MHGSARRLLPGPFSSPFTAAGSPLPCSPHKKRPLAPSAKALTDAGQRYMLKDVGFKTAMNFLIDQTFLSLSRK